MSGIPRSIGRWSCSTQLPLSRSKTYCFTTSTTWWSTNASLSLSNRTAMIVQVAFWSFSPVRTTKFTIPRDSRNGSSSRGRELESRYDLAIRPSLDRGYLKFHYVPLRQVAKVRNRGRGLRKPRRGDRPHDHIAGTEANFCFPGR